MSLRSDDSRPDLAEFVRNMMFLGKNLDSEQDTKCENPPKEAVLSCSFLQTVYGYRFFVSFNRRLPETGIWVSQVLCYLGFACLKWTPRTEEEKIKMLPATAADFL